MARYVDRRHAGRYLASLLGDYASSLDVLVLGLPRGGIPVAYEVAVMLHVPLDVFLVRKLGVPGHEELATGSTMLAAVRALRQQGPEHIVVAVPIAAPATCDDLAQEVDDIVVAATPQPFYAVGLWYENFSQTTDEEVRDLLARGGLELPATPHK